MAAAKGTGRRCVEPGCARFVGKGKALCRVHGKGRRGREAAEALGKLARQVEDAFGGGGEEKDPPGRAGDFRLRLARGEYGGLLDGAIRAAMAEAAAARGAAEELGALRLALVRLVGELAETEEPVPVAREIARVAGAGVRAARAQFELTGGPKSELEAAMERALDELDAEFAEQDARAAAGQPRIEPSEQRIPGWVPPGFLDQARESVDPGVGVEEREPSTDATWPRLEEERDRTGGAEAGHDAPVRRG